MEIPDLNVKQESPILVVQLRECFGNKDAVDRDLRLLAFLFRSGVRVFREVREPDRQDSQGNLTRYCVTICI